jgi:hypothetical protein
MELRKRTQIKKKKMQNKQKYDIKNHIINCSHWINGVLDIKDIFGFINRVRESEKHRGIDKITIDFNIIAQQSEKK